MPLRLANFTLAVFTLSVLSSKAVRLWQNAHSFPTPLFILLFPIFYLLDACLISIEWLLLRPTGGLLSLLGFLFACLISAITLFAATSRLSFFWQTGGELDWADATAFIFDSEGRKVLLSGSNTALAISISIIVISWIVKGPLFAGVGFAISAVQVQVLSALRWIFRRCGWRVSEKWNDKDAYFLARSNGGAYAAVPTDAGLDGDDGQPALQGLTVTPEQTNQVLMRKRWVARINFVAWAAAATSFLTFLSSSIVFDPDRPYGRAMTTLPVTLFAALGPGPAISCTSGTWPFQDLIAPSLWEPPKGHFKGWAPGPENKYIKDYMSRVPNWIPSELPEGFSRWNTTIREEAAMTTIVVDLSTSATPTSGAASTKTSASVKDQCSHPVVADTFYNPVNDPMKISNLDQALLEPLREAFGSGSVKIKHIALIQMESMREELFPLQHGSGFHELLMQSHDLADREKANEKFAHLTVNTEKITGKPGNFNASEEAAQAALEEWNDQTSPGFGGVNIIGGLTTSSVSTKSTAAIHCGTWPLPVNMFEESELDNYQPCITQILELFNRMKAGSTPDLGNFRNQEWTPAFFQSVTDAYDRQGRWNKKIGFKTSVVKSDIKNDGADEKEINYFGYPETVLKSYMEAYIDDLLEHNQRMFLSHFTSTTHHPWATPEEFNVTDYMGSARGGLTDSHKDMNKYLNTIRFTDSWLGQMMQIFENKGIANETLVIFVGDHGQAFKEDIEKTGTYGNPHVSNARVPITFRHPRIPRVQHRVNVTSMSILPTVLDLLVSTGSLTAADAAAASDLLHDYEGQSLIRRHVPARDGRRAWNFQLVNPGGEILTMTSADAPWRLVLPLEKKTEYILSNLDVDPLERKTIREWTLRSLRADAQSRYGKAAAEWLDEADAVAQWWVAERKRLWRYQGDM